MTGSEPTIKSGLPAPRVRRIGFFSLGITLVLTGALLLATLLLPRFPMAMLSYVAPALLMLLGLEVLYYTLLYKGEAKLDFFSGLLCLLFAAGALSVGALPPFLSRISPAYADAETRITAEARMTIYDRLQAQGLTPELSADLTLASRDYARTAYHLEDLGREDFLHLSASFVKPYLNTEEFAKDAAVVAREIGALGLPPYTLYIYSQDPRHRSEQYYVHLSSFSARGMTAERLQPLVETQAQQSPVEETGELLKPASDS